MRERENIKSVEGANGFALIEVLVAVFVLAIGILGAGAIQTMGLKANQGAYLRSQAVFLASDIMDRMRANRAARATYVGVDTNAYPYPVGGANDCAASCSAAAVAALDIQDWVNQIKSGNILPGARGQIDAVPGAGDSVRVTITWGETDWNNGVRDDVNMSYVVTTAINTTVK